MLISIPDRGKKWSFENIRVGFDSWVFLPFASLILSFKSTDTLSESYASSVITKVTHMHSEKEAATYKFFKMMGFFFSHPKGNVVRDLRGQIRGARFLAQPRRSTLKSTLRCRT